MSAKWIAAGTLVRGCHCEEKRMFRRIYWLMQRREIHMVICYDRWDRAPLALYKSKRIYIM